MKIFLLNFGHRVQNFWRDLPFREQVGVIIILQLALIAPFISSSGSDFYTTFREATLTGEYGVDTWNPYPAYWLLTPFALLPPKLGFLFWNLLTAVCFIVAIRWLNGRYLPFALSLPCFWILYVGQFEGLSALGLALGLFASPLWAGLGVALLTLKPQIGVLPILFILIQRRNYRLLIIPAVIYLLSLLYWGWWLPEWIDSILTLRTTSYSTNISLWPTSLILLPLLFFKRSSLKLWLLVQSLLMPYFAVYSLAIYFVVYLPLWANVLTWGLYVGAIFYPVKMPGFIIPLGLLGHLIYENRKQWQQYMPPWLVSRE
ncbi:hypothetical protein MNBD_CHLOROFLEXI01-3248 [hydrothermal vent metagenome]|uniref:DUF2029 domain-containing protein n=1 Tax=hydrothermal vent metagenome TaxID=652676 RepID=A0A3B0VJK8_9ZZZZ